jgi:hypothetical protein
MAMPALSLRGGPAGGSAPRGCRGRRTARGPNGPVRSGAGMPPRQYRGRTLNLSTVPAIACGALAGFAAASGAEWSLFWPTIGIAPDSWARVILSLDRPVAAPGLGVSFAGARTESAAGTDVSAAVDGVVPAWTWTGSTSGMGGSERSLSQAVTDGAILARTERPELAASRYPRLTAYWRPGGLISISRSTTTVAWSRADQDYRPCPELAEHQFRLRVNTEVARGGWQR